MKNLSKDDLESLNAVLACLIRRSDRYRKPEKSDVDNNIERAVGRKKEKPANDDIVGALLSGFVNKYASYQERPPVQVPSDSDLRRMYDVVQADANLTRRLAGLGFGNTGDAYRKAALKLHILTLLNVLRDGKNIRNDIVHRPGYIPSEQSTSRALGEYAQADNDVSEYLRRKF